MYKIMLLPTLMLILLGNSTGIGAVDEIPYQKQPFDELLVAGQPTLEQLEGLAEAGYTTIINLRMPGEFDDFDEAVEVERLGLRYVHIPIRNIESITREDAEALNQALVGTEGPVLLHCTVGWRAAGLLAIERYLFHDASVNEALDIAARAHMSHATRDVEDWIEDNG